MRYYLKTAAKTYQESWAATLVIFRIHSTSGSFQQQMLFLQLSAVSAVTGAWRKS